MLLTLIAASLLTLSSIRATRPLIAHTQLVQAVLLQARGALVEAEAAQLAFLLVQDRSALAPLEQAEKAWPAIVADLRVLTESDDREQHQRIDRLDRLASAKIRELRSSVELLERGERDAALSFVREGPKGSLMAAPRNLIDELRAEETRLLERRTAAARRDLEVAMWIDGCAAAALILLGIFLYRINRDIARREALEAALRESSAFQERFVGILGHDLRNPLSAISATTDLLLRRNVPDPRTALERIASSAARMRGMVDQLLDLTRARLAGGIPIHPKAGTNLCEVTRAAVDELRVAYPQTPLTLRAAADVDGEWDADRMAEVVSNLVGNAIFHGEGAPVDIEVKGGGSSAILEVHNGGAPIPADQLPGIFDPFRRAARGATPSANGLGLGLFITREIVVAHGGSIDVISRVREGTTFRVTLPARAAQNSYAEARNR